jgi:hypothetical protein
MRGEDDGECVLMLTFFWCIRGYGDGIMRKAVEYFLEGDVVVFI